MIYYVDNMTGDKNISLSCYDTTGDIMIYYVIIWWSWSSISSCGGAPKQISTPAEIGKGRRTEKMSTSSSSQYQKSHEKSKHKTKTICHLSRYIIACLTTNS